MKTTRLAKSLLREPYPLQQCRSGAEKKNLENLFSLVLSQFRKYHHPENLKFNYLGIFQSLKLCISMKKKVFQFLLT